jgi:glutamyl-tRNA reductase
MDDIIANSADRFIDNRTVMTIVDLAIPRDIEFDGSRYPAVDVLNMDDIKEYVKDQEIKKQAEIPKAQEIIDRRLGEFVYWFDHVRHEPIYNGLDDSFETIRKQEISLILKRLPSNLREEVDESTKRMVNRLLQIKVRTSSKD